jgi:uncharacterized membrane protein YozB (DUF420 family)
VAAMFVTVLLQSQRNIYRLPPVLLEAGRMFPNALLEQESLTLIFVALGLGIIGMVYGRIKSKETLHMHRWIMTGAVVLNVIGILVVMLPSLFNFYTNPAMDTLSPFSFLQIIHAIIAFPAINLAVIFAFNDLPKPTKKWMRITAVLWVTSIAMGAIIYFTMPN